MINLTKLAKKKYLMTKAQKYVMKNMIVYMKKADMKNRKYVMKNLMYLKKIAKKLNKKIKNIVMKMMNFTKLAKVMS